MSECFRAVKTSVFIGILFVCIFVIFTPRTLSEDSKNNLIIDVTAKQVYKETTPGQRVTFDIELENLGDERIRISCEILKLPEDWNAEIVSEVILESKTLGKDSISTISFVVQTPDDFGYWDVEEAVGISFAPMSYMNNSVKGDEYKLTFIVRNRGWALTGLDAILIIITLVVISIVVFLIVKKRQ